MNKLSQILIPLIVMFFTSLMYSQNQKKLWTLEQIKEIAKRYGMEEYVSKTRNTALLYEKKEDVEEYFKEESELFKREKIFQAFSERTKYIRTYDDYLNLLKQYPIVEAEVEKTHGGKEAFSKYNEIAKKEKWRIYRNKSGGLAFRNAAFPIEAGELNFGKRVDNLYWEK
jgi:hypothetical protein